MGPPWGKKNSMVVDLRPNFYRRFRKPILSLIVLVMLLGWLTNKVFTKGEVADFYPTTCLGTWNNPQNAQGEPETLHSTKSIFDGTNSASLLDSAGEIYCGGFLSQEFQAKGNLKSAALTLVWQIGSTEVFGEEMNLPSSTEPIDVSVPEESQPVQNSEEDASAKASFWSFARVANAQEDVSPAEPPPAPPAESSNEEKTAPAPDSQTKHSPESSSEQNPSDSPSNEEPIVIEGPPLKADLSPIEEASTTPSSTLTSEPTSVPVPLSEPDDNFLRISYSFDGQSWFELQKVNPRNWPNLTVSLPVTSWDELRKIQISIAGIPTTLKELPKIHLDGMLIETQYEVPPLFGGEEKVEDVNDEFEDYPIVPLENDGLASSTKIDRSFKANESPSFDFNLDSLPSSTHAQTIANPVSIPETPSHPTPTQETPPPQPASEKQTEDSTPAENTAPSSESTPSDKSASGDEKQVNPEPIQNQPSENPTPDSTPQDHTPPAENTEPQTQSWLNSKKFGAKNNFLPDFFLINALKAHAQTLETGLGKPTTKNPVVAEVIDPRGEYTNIKPVILRNQNQFRVSVPEPSKQLRPGLYKLRVWMLKEGTVYVTETDFTWGVLVVNFNKSIYTKDDVATIGIGVLNDVGRTICDADIQIKITTPTGKTRNFNTKNETVAKSEECGPITVTNIPDYFATTTADELGLYQVTVTASTVFGTRESQNSFQVQNKPEFDVERIGPTRIYPLAAYKMVIKVKANKDFEGSVIESVPGSFEVWADGQHLLEEKADQKTISWPINIKSGESAQFSYELDAPDISPELYKLGPISIGSWQEMREWQIASDAVQANGRLFSNASTTNQIGQIHVQTRSDTDGWAGSLTTGTVPVANQRMMWMTAKHAPTRDEIFVAAMHQNGTMSVTKCIDTCDNSISDMQTDATDNFTKASVHTGTVTCDANFGNCTKPFDIAYEQLSGDGLLVFASSSGTGPLLYCTFDGTSWSGTNCGTPSTLLTGSTQYNYVHLIPEGDRFTSNRTNRVLLIATNSSTLTTGIWNGSSWGSTSTLNISGGAFGSSSQMTYGFWENAGDRRAVVFFGRESSTVNLQLRSWSPTSSAWTASSSIGGPASGESGRIAWLHASSDPKSNRGCITTQTRGGDNIDLWMWQATSANTTWKVYGDTAGAEGDRDMASACAWEKFNNGAASSAAVFFVTDQAANNTADWVTAFSNGTVIGSSTGAMPGGTGQSDDPMLYSTWGVVGAPHSDEIMGVFEDINCDLYSNYTSTSSPVLSAPRIDPGGSTTSSDNIPPDAAAVNGGTECFGYSFVYMPYSGWSRNWRFYRDATSTTPSNPSAGENVRPTSTPKNTPIRLRIQDQELANSAETDTRKKLQFVASTTCPDPDNCSDSNWINVGEFNNGTAAWRYASTSELCAGCIDGQAMLATSLTSSTQTSTYILSGTGPTSSAMDFGALQTTEIDFGLVPQLATSSETYFFRLYDVQDGTAHFRKQITGDTSCLGTTCTYPSITIAANNPPIITAVTINQGNPIILLPGTTSTVPISFNISDNDGCGDVISSGRVTTTLYRSSMGSSCALSYSNCYIITAVTSSCSGGNSANATASVDVYYFADATDASSSYSGQNWLALVSVKDGANATSATSSASGVELNTMLAVDLGTTTLNYGSVNGNSNTSSTNQISEVFNDGNSSATLSISGNALSYGGFSIPTSSQHYATGTFTYGGLEQALQSAAQSVSGFLLGGRGANLASWATTTALASPVWSQAVASYNGYIYSFGGQNSVGITTTVRFAQVSATSSVGQWATTTPVSVAVDYQGGVAMNGYLYSIGGYDGVSATTSVRFAQINSTGSIGAWTSTTALPSATQYHGVVGNNGYIYSVGGFNGSNATSVVRFAQINSSGSISAWSSTTPYTTTTYSLSVSITNNYIYGIGGNNGSESGTSTVRFAPISATGSIGAWTSTTPLPVGTYNHSSVIFNGFLYVLGGTADSGVTQTSTVIFAPILSNGSLGAWQNATPMPTGQYTQALSYYGNIFTIGGLANGVYTSTVRVSKLTSQNIYWGFGTNTGVPQGTYTGTVTYTAVFSP